MLWPSTAGGLTGYPNIADRQSATDTQRKKCALMPQQVAKPLVGTERTGGALLGGKWLEGRHAAGPWDGCVLPACTTGGMRFQIVGARGRLYIKNKGSEAKPWSAYGEQEIWAFCLRHVYHRRPRSSLAQWSAAQPRWSYTLAKATERWWTR